MSTVSGNTWNGTKDDQFKRVNTKILSDGSAALQVSTTSVGARASTGTINCLNAAEADRTFTTTFSESWEISRIQIKFSSSQSRDITIYNFDGTNNFTELSDTGDTSTTYIYPAQYEWIGTATDEVKVLFSQTAGSCVATIRVLYKDVA